jgi:hypothetical protein
MQRDSSEQHGWGQDLGLFRDDDGKGYLVYDDGHRNIRVDLLADDYQSVSGKTTIALRSDPGAGKRYEGAAMAKYKGRYIVAGSGVRGWNPTDTSYAVADAPLGPYREMGLMSEQNTWSSQISNFVHIKESDIVFAMCDQWFRGPNGERVPIDQSCQLWLPVSFDARTVMWNKLLDDIQRCGGYKTDEADFMRRLLDQHGHVFSHQVAPSSLHMDVWAQNILADDMGNLTGLLDWDRALWGDPEIEFAVLDYCGISEPAFWEGCGAARERSRESDVRRVFYLLYELPFAKRRQCREDRNSRSRPKPRRVAFAANWASVHSAQRNRPVLPSSPGSCELLR